MLIDASHRAKAAGLPFNRFITILWQLGGADASCNARLTGAFIKRIADWLRLNGYRLAWSWVQENSRKNGAHVHILLHMPAELDPLFRTKPLEWAKALLPGQYVAGVMQCQRIHGAGAQPGVSPLHEANLKRKLKYMLKGCDHATGASLGLPRRGEASIVIGKRLGVWQRRRTPPAVMWQDCL
ncbi:hypothetical protein GCM10011529_30090 [Polymorphobacter glacialis]|uniref:Uncharacterized protein n=1 Tax=Sandarakinorhabdus glacialis TaxID=1614636 RepID=A0A917EC49_9SPHN|nr:hypothetical protein [Polymorphobacter glacialis]GGE21442.1 hypothetical protein GCM10011529_30090 [Polymorphobacter glacialis]